MSAIFIIILVYVFSIGQYMDLSQYGIYEGCPLINLLTFHFIHANFIHLLLNCIFIGIYYRLIKPIGTKYIYPILLTVPVIAGYFSMYETPTVGSSAIVMSMLGILVAYLQRKQQIRTLIILSISCAITGLFAQHINTTIHIYSFSISFVLSLLLRYVRSK